MAENNNGEIVKAGAKKSIRKGYIFMSFVPFAIVMAVQTATTTPGIILAMIDMDRQGLPFEMATMMGIYNKKYALWGYIAYCVICIALFVPWYIKSYVKKDPKVLYKKALGFRPWVLSVSVMVCLFFVVNGAFTVVNRLLPEVMERYNYLMQITSFGTDVLITVIYGYLLGPVTEELCFRGIMFSMLDRSGIHHIAVIVIQGFLFGLMHMNPVQSIYAFVLGVILGYLRYRYRTVIITVIVHVVFNVFGTYVELSLAGLGITENHYLLFGGIGLILTAVLMIAVIKDKTVYTEDRKETQVISSSSSDAS